MNGQKIDVRVTRQRPAIVIVLAAVLTAAFAQSPRVLTPDLILGIAQVTDAQIAPDGQSVVYQVARPRRVDEPPGGALTPNARAMFGRLPRCQAITTRLPVYAASDCTVATIFAKSSLAKVS